MFFSRAYFRTPTILAIAAITLAVVNILISGWTILRLNKVERFLGKQQTFSTSTIQTIQVVSVEPRSIPSFYPSALTSRSAPAVLALKVRGSTKSIGSATALTADGWLAAPSVIFGSHRAADILVAWNQQWMPIQSAIRDKATNVIYIKIEAAGLLSPRLLSARSVTTGASVWIEPLSKRIYPEMVIDVRLNREDIISSEIASRRFLLSGSQALSGGAVWDGNGELVGLLESWSPEGWRVIPGSSISRALAAVLADKDIEHAMLGIRSIDLSSFITDKSEEDLPRAGSWITGDKRTGMSAILARTPASEILKEGDVITRIDRDVLDGTADIGERLLEYIPGSEVALYGIRNGSSFETKVKLSSRITSEKIK